MTNGQRLKELRDHLGLTQFELAKKAGIWGSYLSKAERDERPLNPQQFAKVLDVCNCSEEYFNREITTQESKLIWTPMRKRK